MRIWDISPRRLCRSHLLGEHRELHAVWTILTENKRGYRHHPEVLRWGGALKALYYRHERLAAEMARRGYNHRSPLDRQLARGRAKPGRYVDTIYRQFQLLSQKGCECRVWTHDGNKKRVP